MDFGTMRKKLENQDYGLGSKGMSALYHDFLLVMDNCALYNDDNDEVLEEAARMLKLLPEIYADACILVTEKLTKKSRHRKPS